MFDSKVTDAHWKFCVFFQVHVHHTMVSVYEQIGMSVLPVDYLPDDYTGPSAGKVQDIIGIYGQITVP